MPELRIALAQTNPSLGALEQNTEQVLDACRKAAASGAPLVVTGEMALTGHPVDDLALNTAFRAANVNALENLATQLVDSGLGELTVVVGHLGSDDHGESSSCVSALRGGTVVATHDGQDTPTTFEVGESRIGLLLGEQIGDAAVDLMLALDARPFVASTEDPTQAPLESLAKRNNCHVARVNLVGAQDDIVFEGGSYVLAPTGELVARAAQFSEELLVVDFEADDNPVPAERLDTTAQLWWAIVTGLRDYMGKNGFRSVLLGMSGGADSTLVAALAVDALGPENVFGISNPSAWSTEHSRTDAQDQAERMEISLRTIPIAPMVDSFQESLALTGVAEENLQARIRAVIWMGLSNEEGHVVLACGNKSEVSVGYSTIYGDAVGGYAPIKDLSKTLVWELSRWRNSLAESRGETPPIPQQVIDKPPSAELRPGQLDSDSLPSYDVLDPILEALVERGLSQAETVAEGHDPATVERVAGLVDRAEYKRHQYPPGPKLTKRAFGRDRLVPISHRWRESR